MVRWHEKWFSKPILHTIQNHQWTIFILSTCKGALVPWLIGCKWYRNYLCITLYFVCLPCSCILLVYPWMRHYYYLVCAFLKDDSLTCAEFRHVLRSAAISHKTACRKYTICHIYRLMEILWRLIFYNFK